ncbi:MAG: hypothetical protein JRJ79_14335 [Deltaproteobacteria bacterium]|nr:hypothetical protein [Deltaproteobacteria bacterium]
MTLTIRKIIVLGLVGAVLLAGNILFVAKWLADTIIAVLLILLVSPRRTGGLVRRCPVCDHRLLTRGNYCSECGSRI